MSGLRVALIVLLFAYSVLAQERSIQCYQCDSDFDPNCPADKPFDRNMNALVDCSSDEAHTPGSVCVKEEYRSPGWYGWHKVTRRCGSLVGSDNSKTKSTLGQGVFVVTINCNYDGCNSASSMYLSMTLAIFSSMMSYFFI